MARSVRGSSRAPQRAAARTGKVAGALRSLFDGSPLAPRTSFNVPVGRRRRFTGVRIPLADVKAIRAATGGTVNDVVLAGVGGRAAPPPAGRGDDLPASLRVLCPVSVRDESEHLHLGNRRVGDVRGAAGRRARPRGAPGARSARRRATSRSGSRPSAPRSSSTSPSTPRPSLLGLAARLVHRQPFVNLVVTNVPGPQVPLYCLGARMLEAYPMVPLSRNLSLGVAILSYCGVLHFGLLRRR